jgi:hypothetical protein
VVQWPNFEGYGFVVHTLKDLPGQYVGQVEKNSPAEAAGKQVVIMQFNF